jgi:hypothetical protein
MVVHLQMAVTARVGFSVGITNAKAAPSNMPKTIKECPTKEVRLLELQNRIKRRFDISIIFNFFSYIYCFYFSGILDINLTFHIPGY